ncbi:hypothetical protein AB0D49_26205 [Streptomyces sp. NPDC048290]|uniref:hypothetical protein n=1 Tax=Streptomyces sp. NPDC048290 TaxID=3155811 RepID=UPI0034272EED
MYQEMKKFRLAGVGLLASFAAVVAASAPASASVWGYPDEGTQWSPVTYSGGTIRSGSTEAEARDNRGNILHAWRGADNDGIWISLNNSNAFQLPATAGSTGHAQTWAAPTVIWTDDGGRGNFRIFHTGQDGHLYQHRVQLTTGFQLPAALPSATRIPHDARTYDQQSVAAAALPNNSYLLAWNSQTTDDIWAMYYDGGSSSFISPSIIPNARSKDAPALAAQVGDGPAPWNQIVLAFTGLDHNVYMARQQYGAPHWSNPRNIGGWTAYAPSVALSGNGYGVIALTERDFTMGSFRIARDGQSSDFYEENSYAWAGPRAPLAVVNGSGAYYVINGSAGGQNGVLWKKATDFGWLPHPPAS